MPRQDFTESTDSEPDAEAIEAAFLDFPDGFRPSRKGGRWRTYDDGERTLTLTIFLDKFDRYCWCIADSEGPRFSKTKYDAQEFALSSLWRELSGCW
jgi:hypothetical protein